MNEFVLYRAFLFGAGIVLGGFLFLGFYVKFSTPIQHWFANLRMKSLFWRDQRQRKKK